MCSSDRALATGLFQQDCRFRPLYLTFCFPNQELLPYESEEFAKNLPKECFGRLALTVGKMNLPVINQTEINLGLFPFANRILWPNLPPEPNPTFVLLEENARDFFPLENVTTLGASVRVPVLLKNTPAFAKETGYTNEMAEVFLADQLPEGIRNFFSFYTLFTHKKVLATTKPENYRLDKRLLVVRYNRQYWLPDLPSQEKLLCPTPKTSTSPEKSPKPTG